MSDNKEAKWKFRHGDDQDKLEAIKGFLNREDKVTIVDMPEEDTLRLRCLTVGEVLVKTGRGVNRIRFRKRPWLYYAIARYKDDYYTKLGDNVVECLPDEQDLKKMTIKFKNEKEAFDSVVQYYCQQVLKWG